MKCRWRSQQSSSHMRRHWSPPAVHWVYWTWVTAHTCLHGRGQAKRCVQSRVRVMPVERVSKEPREHRGFQVWNNQLLRQLRESSSGLTAVTLGVCLASNQLASVLRVFVSGGNQDPAQYHSEGGAWRRPAGGPGWSPNKHLCRDPGSGAAYPMAGNPQIQSLQTLVNVMNLFFFQTTVERFLK